MKSLIFVIMILFLQEEDLTNINRILDLLDADDDVQEVFHNWDE